MIECVDHRHILECRNRDLDRNSSNNSKKKNENHLSKKNSFLNRLIWCFFSLFRNGTVNGQNVDALYDSSVCIGLCVNVNCEYFICFDG